jgi:hypothetical protein
VSDELYFCEVVNEFDYEVFGMLLEVLKWHKKVHKIVHSFGIMFLNKLIIIHLVHCPTLHLALSDNGCVSAIMF